MLKPLYIKDFENLYKKFTNFAQFFVKKCFYMNIEKYYNKMFGFTERKDRFMCATFIDPEMPRINQPGSIGSQPAVTAAGSVPENTAPIVNGGKPEAGRGTDIEITEKTAEEKASDTVITNNLKTFIEKDSKLHGVLFSAGVIDEQGNFKVPIQKVADEITAYYQQPGNMAFVKVTDAENRAAILETFDGIIEADPQADGVSYKIKDHDAFSKKIAELIESGYEISGEKGNELGDLEQTTTETTVNPTYGKIDPAYIDKIRSNYINKFGEQGEEMFRKWVETNVQNGMIIKADKGYYTKSTSGMPIVETDDEESKIQKGFLDRYDANKSSATIALSKTKYFKDVQNIKASLEGAYANDKLILQDELGQHPIGALDNEYYSMILSRDSEGNITLSPKYFNANDPQWIAYCAEQSHWENEFNAIMKQENEHGTNSLTDEQVRLKQQMMLIDAYSNITEDITARTKRDIEGLNKPFNELSEYEKNYIREYDLSGTDITRLSQTYAASQMKADKMNDSVTPHPKFDINFGKMAEVAVYNRFDHQKSAVLSEYAMKLANPNLSDADRSKLITEREKALAGISKAQADAEMEDRSDYATLMTKGKLGRDEAKETFENTVPHWDKSDKRIGKKTDDGKHHTDIGKKGRAFVEGSGTAFAQKVEVTANDDYDFTFKDRKTGETKYYKLEGNATKDDYDFIAKDKNGKEMKDKNGQPLYCKFDGNQWKTFWSGQADVVTRGQDPQLADYFGDLDEARGKVGQYLTFTGKGDQKRYDKQKYINGVRDLMESAGVTTEANNTVGLQALELVKGAAMGAATGVGAQVFGNLCNMYKGIGYSASAMAYFDAVVQFDKTVHVKQHWKDDFKQDITNTGEVTQHWTDDWSQDITNTGQVTQHWTDDWSQDITNTGQVTQHWSDDWSQDVTNKGQVTQHWTDDWSQDVTNTGQVTQHWSDNWSQDVTNTGQVTQHWSDNWSQDVTNKGPVTLDGTVTIPESTTVVFPDGSEFVEQKNLHKDVTLTGDGSITNRHDFHREGDVTGDASITQRHNFHREGDVTGDASITQRHNFHREGDVTGDASITQRHDFHREGDVTGDASITQRHDFHREGDVTGEASITQKHDFHREGDVTGEASITQEHEFHREGDVETDVEVHDEKEVHDEQEVKTAGRTKPGLFDGIGSAATLGAILGFLGTIPKLKYVRDKVNGKSNLREVAQQQYVQITPPEKSVSNVTNENAKVYTGVLNIQGTVGSEPQKIENTAYKIHVTSHQDEKGRYNLADDKKDLISKAYNIPTTDPNFDKVYTYIMENVNNLKKGQYGDKQYLKENLTWYLPQQLPASLTGLSQDYTYNLDPKAEIKQVRIDLNNDKQTKITYVPGSNNLEVEGKKRKIEGQAYN